MVSSAIIEKWIRMLRHKSVLHVNQSEGNHYSVSEISGYYNNFCEKLQNTKNYDEAGIPLNVASYGDDRKKIYFPIAIFQYGLGAYDMWLETKINEYYNAFLKMADWAVDNQEDSGAWSTFGVLHYSNPYSAMSQGEGASLLARAFKETKDERYYISCIKAVDYMLLPTKEGGTCQYTSSGLILKEYPDKEAVLNGWIFSAFGLFDTWKITEKQEYLEMWKKTENEIKYNLNRFNAGHWSFYDLSGKISSPFYHSLHIELLKALNNISPSPEYKKYIDKWSTYKKSWYWSKVAFVRKAIQKITEKQTDEWVIIN